MEIDDDKKSQKNRSIKKHNSLTSGYLPNNGRGILPDKLLNALYWKYEQEGEEFTISMQAIRELLELKSNKDNERVIEALGVLSQGLILRNFSIKGREVHVATTAFCKTTTWKDDINTINVVIDPMVIEYMKEKSGYTPIQLHVSNALKTKYGLKLYELYMQYETLPNNKDIDIGTIAKTLEQLNKIFGTEIKYISKMKEGIKRGLKEIEKVAGISMTCHYDKIQKTFNFYWSQEHKGNYPELKIPYTRIDELIEWYISLKKDLKINNRKKYKESLKEKILNDTFGDLDEYWFSLLLYKYGVPREEIRGKIYFNQKTKKWLNFKKSNIKKDES